MATHFSTLAWEIPWTKEPDLATVHGVAKNQSQLKLHTNTTNDPISFFSVVEYSPCMYVLPLPHACFIEQPVKIMCSQTHLILSFSVLILSLHSSQQTDS